jgi:hypothetical protein
MFSDGRAPESPSVRAECVSNNRLRFAPPCAHIDRIKVRDSERFPLASQLVNREYEEVRDKVLEKTRVFRFAINLLSSIKFLSDTPPMMSRTLPGFLDPT